MNVPTSETDSPKRQLIRPWFIALIVGFAILVMFVIWPRDNAVSPRELSRADGKPRFAPTTYPKRVIPANASIKQRLTISIQEYVRRHAKKNPAAYTFSPHPIQPSSIDGLLNQAMQVTGTRYWIAVEIVGAVNFGMTNTMNGTQWATAFERAIEESKSVVCYDYATQRTFDDTVLLIREKPGVVKLVPRSKLAEYQKLGLVDRKASDLR